MKVCGQQKRKATQILKENSEQTGGVHKNSSRRKCKQLQESAAALEEKVSMKVCGQQQRKVTQILKENSEQTGGVYKNSSRRKCKPLKESAGKLTSSSVGSGQWTKCHGAANSSDPTVLNGEKPLSEMPCLDKFKLERREPLSSAKIKLQLFPVNETTRLRLEKDGSNPFLELTLSTRKKISSVIKHLYTKWGNSREGAEELMLFPYNMKWEKAVSCRRWTVKDSSITAGDLYASLEFPAVFRLSYGWFSSLSVDASGASDTSVATVATSEPENSSKAGNLVSFFAGDCTEKLKLNTEEIRYPSNVHETADANVMSERRPLVVPAADVGDDVMTHGVPMSSALAWDDGFTSLSIGGLLSEASLLDKINRCTTKSESGTGLQPLLAADASIGHFLSETISKDKINGYGLKSDNEAGMLKTESSAGKSTEGLYIGVSSQDKNSSPGLKTEHEVGMQGIPLASGKSTDSKVELPAWDDGLTTLSIGGLLSEASLLERINPKPEGTTSNLKNLIASFDSFDGIASAQHKSHPQISKSSLLDSSSSIFDSEMTCHGFAFQNLTPSGRGLNSVSRRDVSVFSLAQTDKKSSTNSLPRYDEDSSLGIKGIKWNDSRGPFDLGLPMVQPVSSTDRVSRFFK